MQRYFRHKINNLIVVNNVVTIHYFEFTKNFKTDGESHNFWEIVYAVKNDIICTADGQKILLSEGEMLFHKPNEFHTLSANNVNAPNVFIISFYCKSPAMRFFENKKISADKDVVKYIFTILNEAKHTFNIPRSNPELKKMELLPTPTLGGEQIIKNYLEIMLVHLLRSLTETKQGNNTFLFGGKTSSTIFAEIDKTLNANVYAPLNIEQLCEMLNYSRSYLFKIVKKETGQGVIEYFIKLKIEKAKQFLRENELNVKQIADKLCFDTPNYFSKTFKKITGLTPTQYKSQSY